MPNVNAMLIRDRLPIAEVLRAHGIAVTHNRTACPLHGGENPQAFSIASSGKWAQCWSCGFRGDVIDLAIRLHKDDRKAGFKWCLERAGLAKFKLNGETAKRIERELWLKARARDQHRRDITAAWWAAMFALWNVEADLAVLNIAMRAAPENETLWDRLGVLVVAREQLEDEVEWWRTAKPTD